MEQQESVPHLTQLAQGAAMLHELFLSYLEAGFTETQALNLIGIMLAHAPTPTGDGS